MKVTLMVIVFALTGCMTGRPCPKSLGGPKETCTVIIIPGPQDVFTDTLQAAGTLRTVFKGETGQEGQVYAKEN